MSPIKSLEDLKRVREEALEKRRVKANSGEIQIIVGMGTTGIAAGARETMKAILDTIEKDSLTGIIVTQTGGFGLDANEPIIQVIVGDQPKVTYGKVTAEVARQIMKEHVVGGKVVQEYVIQA
ncbi:MAG TPA: (2Fe-2S) ferredoxin domain-containing protein [Anaerolineaceae bacterium]|nr:(2Fe-2S) ferredoxin domain-containing protein [Anaerolineaceae bacterium]HPN50287.1 (2Fe-2S) ferredoxin domain-containing protein [Anaerolineaceae bacterium]